MLGIDTSKKKLHCALRDPADRRLLWEIEVQNNNAGVEKLLKKTPPEIPWVLEPTGRYSQRVAQQALAAGRKTLLAPPRKAKAFLASLQDRAKTDKLDSKGLALFAFSQSLAAYPLKDKALDMIDQLLSARKGLSSACSKLQLQSQELPQAREVLDQVIADMKVRIKALDKQIAEVSAVEPKMAVVKTLRDVPGIGPVTSVAVASRLSQKAFSHPDKFVAYLGLDIGVNESGQHKGQRGLTHQGDAELRRLFFCCAQSSLRVKDSPFKAQYERERAKGLSTTAALCAVARKMAKLCWSLHKNNAHYDASRVYSAPDRRKPQSEEQTPKRDEQEVPDP